MIDNVAHSCAMKLEAAVDEIVAAEESTQRELVKQASIFVSRTKAEELREMNVTWRLMGQLEHCRQELYDVKLLYAEKALKSELELKSLRETLAGLSHELEALNKETDSFLHDTSATDDCLPGDACSQVMYHEPCCKGNTILYCATVNDSAAFLHHFIQSEVCAHVRDHLPPSPIKYIPPQQQENEPLEPLPLRLPPVHHLHHNAGAGGEGGEKVPPELDELINHLINNNNSSSHPGPALPPSPHINRTALMAFAEPAMHTENATSDSDEEDCGSKGGGIGKGHLGQHEGGSDSESESESEADSESESTIDNRMLKEMTHRIAMATAEADRQDKDIKGGAAPASVLMQQQQRQQQRHTTRGEDSKTAVLASQDQ
ncbi:unnamed protein product [Vitrella brassicaformis CCMP3155]|uniref:Uncharacterized protein n=2 Tax=Vitrella brassicaformis TaxID=1169539 RepID=A0A0G4GV38_VITBC|nr:unnamed protein product [Vitrella brassicaformis CCMP3155]|mmetsp:Transcript_47370/g.118323  ORF Transcript_47370/g.118323 Transcript_47370/m.118323 type:complete len:374 (+) Transcript_47370:766-1887(+)|eukprot:CEM34736.1 unnamed protein product [Vitrella brassicaformis CCMP3155]